jgi:hypothetical protein
MPFRHLAVVVICLALALAGRPAAAQRGLKDIPPPDTAAELAEMQVAEGYEVSLFAADPMISKPLQINFDPQGRLWVSSSRVYPQIRPGEVADDTVTILEDRDGDGRADAHTVFATGLLMPTGVLPDDMGGAYVANSTEMLHLADTDGDGRADSRRVLLSGFGAEDTHHIVHTFRRGPDARVYFNQSIYIHSHVETPQGVRRLNGGGIWRFEPESLALDVFARGWVNTWGHVFDPWHRSLATDVELRQAPLISSALRWCSNLAAPDMFWDWSKYLPQFLTAPEGWLGPFLNIFPLVTIGLFLWQQKLFMPPAVDEQQKMQQQVMNYMMWFMAVMFFKVPCGLCLYFIASSLWGIAERLWLPATLPAAAGAGAKVVDSPFAAVSKNGSAAGDATRQKRQARKKQR